MARVVIYLRVSTEEQVSSGLGLEAQEAACRAFVERHTMQVDATFRDEGISGAKGIDKRPGLMDAITSLGKGDTLLVAKLDRIGRDALLLAMLESMVTKKRARIVSVAGEGTESDDPSAVLMRRMVSAFAEYERLLIKARTKSAMKAKAARGERCFRAKLGFTVTSDGKVTRNEEEQKTLERIQQLRSAGLSMRKIAEQLTSEGVPTKSGKARWSHATVQGLLQ